MMESTDKPIRVNMEVLYAESTEHGCAEADRQGHRITVRAELRSGHP